MYKETKMSMVYSIFFHACVTLAHEIFERSNVLLKFFNRYYDAGEAGRGDEIQARERLGRNLH